MSPPKGGGSTAGGAALGAVAGAGATYLAMRGQVKRLEAQLAQATSHLASVQAAAAQFQTERDRERQRAARAEQEAIQLQTAVASLRAEILELKKKGASPSSKP